MFATVAVLGLLSALRIGVIEALILLLVLALAVWKLGTVRPSPAVWCRTLAWVAWVVSVPVIGFALFFATQLSQDQGYNPTPSEALRVPLFFIGAFALPLAGIVLWRTAAARRSDSPRQGSSPANPWPRRIFILLVILLLGPLLLRVGVLIPSYQRVKFQQTQSSHKRVAAFAETLSNMDDMGVRQLKENGMRKREQMEQRHGRDHPLSIEALEELRQIDVEMQRRGLELR